LPDNCQNSQSIIRSNKLEKCLNSNKNLGKGQNYEFHNVEIQKERQKKFKASERQNCLFSFSLLRNQNVENGFLVDQNVENE